MAFTFLGKKSLKRNANSRAVYILSIILKKNKEKFILSPDFFVYPLKKMDGSNFMLKDSKAYGGFSVNDLGAAKKFYVETLGLELDEAPMGLKLKITGGSTIFIYPKENHVPATYTVLNFPVNDVERTVDELSAKGVVFEQYDNVTDKKGIAKGFPQGQGVDIAWFKDPAGNIISVLKDR